jgi:hypothetical protein
MAPSSASDSRGGHLVVLVSDSPTSRIAKVGYGLRSLGCRVVLLHQNVLPTEDPARCFDETHVYRDAAQALQLARQFGPVVYHVFSSWNFDTAAVFMKDKPGRVVFDDYDVISGVARPEFLAAHHPTLMGIERYCLENADGITCRDLLLQNTKRDCRYRLGGRLLYLPDCCWGDAGQGGAPARGIDTDQVQLAYVGNMAIEKFASSPHPRDNFYLLDFAKELTAAGIQLHVYPSPSFAQDFENTLSDHLELAARTPFYQVHRPLPADKLIQEISQYDLGLLSMWRESPHRNRAYLPAMFRDGTSNKLFDYMDAGLGIVTCDIFRFTSWFLRKEKICISAYLEDVTEALLSTPLSYWRGLRQRAALARDRFSAKLHARRLLAFYESVAGYRSPCPAEAPGKHLALAQQAFQRGEIGAAIFEAELELRRFPGQPEAQHFLSFLQTYSRKRERMSL